MNVTDQTYWSGNREHADLPKRYIADIRKMIDLLMAEDIRTITGTMQVLWISDRLLSNHELRLYSIITQGNAYCSNAGIYVLT